jgi:hypothetical protein
LALVVYARVDSAGVAVVALGVCRATTFDRGVLALVVDADVGGARISVVALIVRRALALGRLAEAAAAVGGVGATVLIELAGRAFWLAAVGAAATWALAIGIRLAVYRAAAVDVIVMPATIASGLAIRRVSGRTVADLVLIARAELVSLDAYRSSLRGGRLLTASVPLGLVLRFAFLLPFPLALAFTCCAALALALRAALSLFLALVLVLRVRVVTGKSRQGSETGGANTGEDFEKAATRQRRREHSRQVVKPFVIHSLAPYPRGAPLRRPSTDTRVTRGNRRTPRPASTNTLSSALEAKRHRVGASGQ